MVVPATASSVRLVADEGDSSVSAVDSAASRCSEAGLSVLEEVIAVTAGFRCWTGRS